MLNFGLLDANTPAQVANSLYTGQQHQQKNALAAAQLKQMEKQNALSDYTLAAKQREDSQAQAYNTMLGSVDLSTPEGLRAAMPKLMQSNPTAALALQKSLDERQKSQLDQGLVKANTTKQQLLNSRALLNGVGDQASWTAWREGTLKGMSDIPGLDAAIPVQFSPENRRSMMLEGDKLLMSAKDEAANKVAQGNLSVAQGNLGVARARLAADLNPAIQEQLAGAKETGKTRAETQIKSAAALPQAIATANTGIRLIDELIGDKEGHVPAHPGLTQTVGAAALPGQRFVPGTDAASFMVRFNQIKDQSFLQAFESLRGGGAITEREGEKATSALNRMSIASSEAEFNAAARDVQDVYRAGIRRAQQKAGAAPASATSSAFKGFSATRVP